MTQDSGYDLRPEEKPAVAPSPAPAAAPVSAPQAAAPVPAAAPLPPGFVPPVPVILGPDDVDPDVADAEEHRVTAILGYLVFMLPLILAPKSKFARYHANQALLVFLSGAVVFFVSIVLGILESMLDKPQLAFARGPLWFLLNCMAWPLCVLFGIGVAALALMGIIHASNGEKNPLPVVGKMKLIK